MSGVLDRAATYGRMIRFSHSAFALPFALTSTALAARLSGITAAQVLWIIVAMVAARSAAMGFNRLVDHELDAKNPRTAGRELPRGVLSRREVWAFILVSTAIFVLAAGMLNPLCLALSPVALAIVLGYSYTKRLTAGSHLILGLALAVAPVGAWLAVRGQFDTVPIVLGLAVLLWVAGFDTIYACQDVAFDRGENLHSIPARVGVATALLVARGMHALAVLLLASLYWLAPLHPVYLVGVAAVALLLAWEHTLVRPDDLSRVMFAFNINGWVSAVYFAFTLAATWLA
jgi:4-hydroxybenzoate polyprenyltransferase